MFEELSAGPPAPDMQVSPDAACDMGVVQMGQSVTKEAAYTIRNNGDAQLTGSISLASGPFELLSNSNINLAPSQKPQLTFAFNHKRMAIIRVN